MSCVVNVPEIDDSLFIRTWFGDEDAWQRTLTVVKAPSPEGYMPYVEYIDDPANIDAPEDDLHEAIDFGEASVAFIADEASQTQDTHPIKVIDVTGDERASFRCPPHEVWRVENDLNLGKCEWDEMASRFQAD